MSQYFARTAIATCARAVGCARFHPRHEGFRARRRGGRSFGNTRALGTTTFSGLPQYIEACALGIRGKDVRAV